MLPSAMNIHPYERQQDDELERHQAAQLAPPPIGLTGVMCEESTVDVTRTLADGTHLNCTLRYRIFRPRFLHSTTHPPPLVVLHGGPSVPSNYLFPLVHLVNDRAIVFHDQVGCGRSSRPSDVSAYSIDYCVNDFQILLQKLKNLQNFHLFGHSFGGIVAFEYLKRMSRSNEDSNSTQRCFSVTLSSAPANIALVEEESKTLLESIQTEILTEGDVEEEDVHRQCLEVFRQRHECRVVPIPLPLLDAYAQAGTVWRGTQAILDYVAVTKEENDEGEEGLQRKMPPALILRGQYDFVTQACVDPWTKLFPSSSTITLAGCSHHALLENQDMFGDVFHSFLVDHDPKPKLQEENDDDEMQEGEDNNNYVAVPSIL